MASVYARSQLHPFGKISVLRETSVLVAMVIDPWCFQKPLNSHKIIDCIAIAFGAVCLVWLKR
jgi:hypothetical protein